jgi:hypothetical protein
VRSDAAGLHFLFAPALLQRSAWESAAHARDKSVPTPLTGLLGRLGPVRVQDMVDAAPYLQRMLTGAALSAQHDARRDGKPMHVLVFDVPPPGLGKEMTVKHYSDTLQVWLDASGIPVAMHREVQVKGRKFFFGIDVTSTMDCTLYLVGKRLVALTENTRDSHSRPPEGGQLDMFMTPASSPGLGRSSGGHAALM